jgi:hypothetical protein
MITSIESSGSGTSSIAPLRNSAFSTPASRWLRRASVLARQLEHLVRHVEAVSRAARADTAGREQHVDAAARPEVEDPLSLVELGDRGRVAAPERGELGRIGKRVAFLGGVEAGAEAGVPAGVGHVRSAAARGLGRPAASGLAVPHRPGRARVTLPDDVSNLL